MITSVLRDHETCDRYSRLMHMTMTMINRQIFAPLLVAVVMLTTASAQTPAPAASEEKGLTSYVEFGGTSNSEGQVYRVDSSVGYKFNQHFATDVGVPIYFVRASSATGTSENGIGNPYLDLKFKALNPTLNFGSVVTGYAPLADSKKGLSTGRATFDWTNRVDHSFSSLTPFADIGLSNTTLDTRLFIRPYTTLGMNTHFEGGSSLDLGRFFSVGASGYDIVPFGQQTVFSKVTPGSAQSAGHGHAFQNNQQTTGSADIAKDDGFSTWIEVTPKTYVDMELAYTRSMNYDLNSVSFTIGMNVGYLAHRKSK
ncbi:MAG TPA: hypothetical protein VF011_16100 [Terriglobales bacterium]